MSTTNQVAARPFLDGIRVLELANELGEYCGKLLAGLGADVVKVEPPEGEETRRYGPFHHDVPDPDRSLCFWHFNLGKRSIVLDLDSAQGRAEFAGLAETADVIIDSRPRGYLDERGIGYERLRESNPALIHVRISPFGDTGPWAGHVGSDLVHLALGGVMMNCGYDPDPSGCYDTPPVAPQMWQSYQIAGEMAVMSVLGALTYRLRTGRGQTLDTSVHQAVSANTELDTPDWVLLRMEHHRLTGRHSMPDSTVPSLAITKDGRYVMPYRTYLKSFGTDWDANLRVLRKYGMQADLDDPEYRDEDFRLQPMTAMHINDVTDTLVGRLRYDREIWRDAQAEGLPWAPIRRPEENVDDDHWQARDTFFAVHHPELGETFTYVGAKWFCPEVPWHRGPRPPLLGEHTATVPAEWRAARPERRRAVRPPRESRSRDAAPSSVSRHGKPFALSGVRVIDLSWMLASAGAGRFLAAMGADVIKVEHASRWDSMRFGYGMCPPGGRAERDAATGPITAPEVTDPDRCGHFMDVNAGKRGISLNLKHPRGKEVLEELIREADMIVEGFSPGTMERMGLGYERLKELNPSIVYVQQSGFGQHGTYGAARAFGPTAQGYSGLTEMSGLPSPFPPAGIGYSYLDWFGAYNMANAMLAALYRRTATGQGCYIDASQTEAGIYLTGTAVLDHSVNGRAWSRYGNRSPYKPAAPHGAYRTRGDDRWIAVAAFTEEHWTQLIAELGSPGWAREPRFATLQDRLRHQDDLDRLLESATSGRDGFELMAALQARSVPAGVCQTAQDRYESDPQLRHRKWMVELDQRDIGTWPVKENPVSMSETPSYIGGPFDHSGPSYGQDTYQVLTTILGMDDDRVRELRESGAL
ncbi:Crotonobetainyl-CoA:carnitine CoA-transferase CaiB [Actinomadura madurae]|uniref:Crotonobetainyl-CoA:carnitine CoA-transferase CaiB n=1 Tax=Actinomadura madurae TaxID=1993 RepID=A0A1I5M4J1_9ACTN|nr:CoA transferase [Actinomadura madurae]SFP04445.1 Crotonobetainyl-CoA:carnitine CoA-transferase CaiB [Actinomadura madurae]